MAIKKLVKTKSKKSTKKRKVNPYAYRKRLEVELTKNGFVVWIKELVKRSDGRKPVRHWIVDASCLKEDGLMRFGAPDLYPTRIAINEEENNIRVIRVKKLRSYSLKSGTGSSYCTA